MESPEYDRLIIELGVYRVRAPRNDPTRVLVCFASDHGSEQRHLLQSTTVPVSSVSIMESLTKIISRIVEGSVFNDASPPGTAAPLQSEASEAERR